jgi:hypothetical protein
MGLFRKDPDKIVRDYERLMTQQMATEYAYLTLVFCAICKRDGDQWVYDKELPEVNPDLLKVERDEKGNAVVFKYDD